MLVWNCEALRRLLFEIGIGFQESKKEEVKRKKMKIIRLFFLLNSHFLRESLISTIIPGNSGFFALFDGINGSSGCRPGGSLNLEWPNALQTVVQLTIVR